MDFGWGFVSWFRSTIIIFCCELVTVKLWLFFLCACDADMLLITCDCQVVDVFCAWTVLFDLVCSVWSVGGHLCIFSISFFFRFQTFDRLCVFFKLFSKWVWSSVILKYFLKKKSSISKLSNWIVLNLYIWMSIGKRIQFGFDFEFEIDFSFRDRIGMGSRLRICIWIWPTICISRRIRIPTCLKHWIWSRICTPNLNENQNWICGQRVWRPRDRVVICHSATTLPNVASMKSIYWTESALCTA